MAKVLVLAVLLGGCSMYFGADDDDVASDAAVVATPDAEVCEPGLPSCASLYCGVGAIPLDCPRAEDTSVCYCPSPTPGWCRQ